MAQNITWASGIRVCFFVGQEATVTRLGRGRDASMSSARNLGRLSLLCTAVGLFTVAVAEAADLPSRHAAPVNYVRTL